MNKITLNPPSADSQLEVLQTQWPRLSTAARAGILALAEELVADGEQMRQTDDLAARTQPKTMAVELRNTVPPTPKYVNIELVPQERARTRIMTMQ